MKKTISTALAILLLVSAALCGCGNQEKANAPENTVENVIAKTPSDANQKSIDGVLENFMRCYEENLPGEALSLFVKDFNGSEEDLDAFFEEIRKVCKNPFVPFDSYYASDLTVSELPVKVRHGEQDEIYLEVTPVSEELFCGIYVSESEKVSYMLSVLLTKEGGSWKIAWISPGVFEYNGEAAPELYEKIEKLRREDKLMSAYIYSCMLANIFRPSEYLRYEKDIEMENACLGIYSEISDKFEMPLALPGTSNSELHSVLITNDEVEGVLPLILVKTDVPVTDRDALVKEGEKIVDALEGMSGGIRESFTHICISATNEQIDENNPTPTVVESFIMPLK